MLDPITIIKCSRRRSSSPHKALQSQNHRHCDHRCRTLPPPPSETKPSSPQALKSLKNIWAFHFPPSLKSKVFIKMWFRLAMARNSKDSFFSLVSMKHCLPTHGDVDRVMLALPAPTNYIGELVGETRRTNTKTNPTQDHYANTYFDMAPQQTCMYHVVWFEC